jgi:small subunit ribosomal protein S16
MAVKIRLRRVGRKKVPTYRVVVTDIRSPRDGRFIEIVGQYNPLANPPLININVEKVNDWIKKGAKPTEKVRSLLKKVKKSQADKPVES